MNLSVDLSKTGPAPQQPPVPLAPHSVAETGLPDGLLLDLLLKTLAHQGMERPSEMADAMKLSVGVVVELIQTAADQNLVHVLGQPGAIMTAEMRYELSDKGRTWADRALRRSSWTGPAPVPIEQFCNQIRRQSVRAEKLTAGMMRGIFDRLTLPEEVMDKIGPAINSGQSILLFGPPGNGKSSIAEAVCHAFGTTIYIPHALTIGDEIVVFFDPAVHEPVGSDGSGPGQGAASASASARKIGLRRAQVLDPRYVACARPSVITGGELRVEKFDIVRNPISGLYDAPLQMKAAGGLFVVDDFGRQRDAPQELINRLIIPLETGLDHLVLQSGRKIEVPFDTLVIFATNYEPRSLMDEAGLRRLRHKILIDRPERKTYVKILVRTARDAGIPLDEETIAYILVDLYGRNPGTRMNAFHPRFLIDQAISICSYRGVPAELSPEILDRAWENLISAH